MSLKQPVLIEGLSPDDVLRLPHEHIDQLILTGKPILFRVGSATILGQFEVTGQALSLELAHIDGGGEGALPTIASLAEQYACRRGIVEIEWFVYATNCARSNSKLQRILARRGFIVHNHSVKGECLYKRVQLAPAVRPLNTV
jgi:hypothetical protein